MLLKGVKVNLTGEGRQCLRDAMLLAVQIGFLPCSQAASAIDAAMELAALLKAFRVEGESPCTTH